MSSVCVRKYMYPYMCMFAFTSEFESMTVTVFTGTIIHGFSSASSMSCSVVVVVTWAHAHTLASTCDSEQMFLQCMKAILLYLNPQVVQCFEHSPKANSIALPFENCSVMNKTLIATSVFLPPFSFFVSFTALFLTVSDTTLCEFRKVQRYPLIFFYG